MADNRVEKRCEHGHGPYFVSLLLLFFGSCVEAARHWHILAHVNSLTSFMILVIFQAKLEELQSEKQSVVSQKEAADDGNRKLVSAKYFVCLIFNTYSPKRR